MRKILVLVLGIAAIGFLAYVFYYQYKLITKDAEIAKEQDEKKRAVEQIKKDVIEGNQNVEETVDTQSNQNTEDIKNSQDTKKTKDSAFLSELRILTGQLTKALTFEKKPSEQKAELARNALIKFFDKKFENSNPSEQEQEDYKIFKYRLKTSITGWVRRQAHNVMNNEKSYEDALKRNSGNKESLEVTEIYNKRDKQRIENERKRVLNGIINKIHQAQFTSSSEILAVFKNINYEFRFSGTLGNSADPEFTPIPKNIVSVKFKRGIEKDIPGFFNKPNHSKAQFWHDIPGSRDILYDYAYQISWFNTMKHRLDMPVVKQDGRWFLLDEVSGRKVWVHGEFLEPRWEEVKN